ncbi:hypothetical protein [Flavobacterium limnosediminis]|nr:hypothetical protein [Flavobacterium limnosediminis]
MTKNLILFLILGIVTACSKDDSSENTTPTTTATIILKDAGGNAVPNVEVYAYEENNWILNNDNPSFADFTVTSNSEGKAIFSNIDVNDNFNESNNYYNNFKFSVHYTLDGSDIAKIVAIPFNKNDNKTATLILN